MKRCLLLSQIVLLALGAAFVFQARSQNSGPIRQAAATSSSPAEKLEIAGVRSGGRVSEELYRGGQPSERGLAELKKLGITTIVNLRGNHADTAWESARVEALGMRYVDIPVAAWAPPTDLQVAQFLKLFREGSRQKIFVHCFWGEDRTGVMVATYRMALEGWTADQALMEMDSFGFHYHIERSMKLYIRRFPRKLNGNSALAPVVRPGGSTGH